MFDCNLSENNIDNIVMSIEKNGIVAFSCMTPNYNYTVELSKKVKSLRPDLLICLGGYHACLLYTSTNQLIAMGVQTFTLAGGEPTLHEGFMTLVKRINEAGDVYKRQIYDCYLRLLKKSALFASSLAFLQSL